MIVLFCFAVCVSLMFEGNETIHVNATIAGRQCLNRKIQTQSKMCYMGDSPGDISENPVM